MHKENRHFFDNPDNIKLVLRIFYGLCLVLLALDFVLQRYVYHSWERLPGFYPLYGFVGCVVLVLVAKWMRKVLMRPETYYEPVAGGDAGDAAGEEKDGHH